MSNRITAHLKAKLFLLVCLFTSSSLLTQTLAATSTDAIIVMSLNVYGWKTMPEHSDDYAQLINRHHVDILGIQEGVEDWQLDTKLPTNYQRAITLRESLGQCWQRKFQIFINHCQGNSFIESGRFDLTDGPNATRTGEYAVIENSNKRYFLVNVHWDHENEAIRVANAKETSIQLNKINLYPKILLGDFNSQCDGKEVSITESDSKMNLLNDAGIDCLFIKGLSGKAEKIQAYPSDHPAIVAKIRVN